MTGTPPLATPRPASTNPATGPLFRLAAERLHSQLDWLDRWHTFSFGSHFDPAGADQRHRLAVGAG